MTTALFGGSFDPVHLGHVNAVRSLLKSSLAPDRVIIMPAFVNPFKAGLDKENRAGCEDRLEMCRIAFEKLPRCVVSDHEIKKARSATRRILWSICGRYIPRIGLF